MDYAGGFGGPDDDVTRALARRRKMEDYAATPDYAREMHERGLQMQEQQRRQYDSETARIGQDKKYSVLSGLMSRMGGGMGSPGGGYGFHVDGSGKMTRMS